MENASKALIIAGAILIAILLISIGVILINSGRDVTSTGTAGMTSQKIQGFNSQFTPYEGTKKGSEIKSLVSTASANNASDAEHQVTVYLPVANAGLLSSTKKYTVDLHYNGDTALSTAGTAVVSGSASEKGYIDIIYVH